MRTSQKRIRGAGAALTVAFLILLTACNGGGSSEPTPSKRTCTPGPPYGQGNWPPAPYWRPYHDQSPFNDLIDSGIRELPNSAVMIQRLLANPQKHPANLVANVDGHSGEPTYYSRDSDPEYTLRCTMLVWGSCPIDGLKIKVPPGAFVEGNTPAKETNNDPGYQKEPDAHLTVVDQASGWEYDLWQVHRSPVNPQDGPELRFSFGGRTKIDGDGISYEGNATAAHFGSLAGRIRAEELTANKIEHALAVVIPCDNGDFIYPGKGRGRKCADTTNAIPMGARLHLNLPANRIEELRSKGVPEWKLTILTALRDYSGYVNDTGSDASWFGFEQEAGSQYTVMGDSNRWVDFAKNAPGWFYKAAGQEPTYPAEHYVGIFRKDADGVDWSDQVWKHLRVIFPDYPNRIQIRQPDPYPPVAALVAETTPGTLESVTDATPTAPAYSVSRDRVVSVIAQGRDGEAGIKDIEIWKQVTTWVPVGGVPIPNIRAPERAAANSDSAAHSPGETVDSNRITAHQIQFGDLTGSPVVQARVVVWATTRTYLGQAVETKRMTLNWP
jgi:hypothetical protein